jgi:uncharacterized membrane protein YfcA
VRVHVADLALLFVAGIGAGVIGSTAGLASLVSYPALLLVGLPPVTANVTNTLGLIGSSIGSISGSRPELVGQGPFLRRWLPFAALGGLAGAGLLLLSPADSFEVVVPFLVAGASLLLLVAPRIRRIRPDGHTRVGSGAAAGIILACAYGGYFGAAAGVLLLAMLLASSDQPLPVSNAVKNVLLGAANATGAVLFAVAAPVDWSAVPALLVGCVLGGRLGPPVVRRLPEAAVRWGVGVAGLALAVKLGHDAFG